MSGITDLKTLLREMHPDLSDAEYVFCTIESISFSAINELDPICTFKEDEGISLVLEKHRAIAADLKFSEVFKQITLRVHSSLEAVGLTAAVSTVLTENGISANVIAAYYHDHIFVPSNKAEIAMMALNSLSDG